MAIRPIEEGYVYRYLSLTDQDKSDLEKFAELESIKNSVFANDYLNHIGQDKDHRLVYLLKNKKLYRSLPSGFNDPYDCLVEFDTENLVDRNLLNWFRQYHINSSFSKEELIELIEKVKNLDPYLDLSTSEIANQEHREAIITILKSVLQRIVYDSRVICFSKSESNLPNNILMWAHYADKHSGYCLTFDVKKLKGSNSLVGLYEVDYHPNELRPLLQLTPEEFKNLEFVKKILLPKSVHWKYEKEVRLIYVNTKEYFDFQAESLTGIVFGAKMPPEYQAGFRFLVETLNELGHVSFSNAELDRKKYAVNIS